MPRRLFDVAFLSLLILALSTAAQAQGNRPDPATQPIIPKGATAYVLAIDPTGDNPIKEETEAVFFVSLANYKEQEIADRKPSDFSEAAFEKYNAHGSPEEKKQRDWERDLMERQLKLEIRPRTRVKILDWKAYVADTPENRREMREIDAITDRAEKVQALSDITTRVYQVEILVGNYKGRRGWVSDWDVVRQLPKTP